MRSDAGPPAPRQPGQRQPGPATVTVYSTPDCVQCRLTYVALEKAGVGYRVVDLEHDPAAREHVTTVLGHTTAPVVVVDQDPAVHWSGFRPDRIAALAGRGPTG